MQKATSGLSTRGSATSGTKSSFLTQRTRSSQRSASGAPRGGSQNWKPHAYQRTAVEFLVERRAAALFLDPGLGKTSCVYAAISALKRAGAPHGTLVVAPRRPAQSVWPKEHRKWAQFHALDVVLVHGPDRLLALREPHDVYVTTYEGFQWLIRSGELNRLLRAGLISNLVYDELSKMKNTHTVRFKTLRKWLARFERRWGLTGSPAANGLMDLFGECYALDLGRALGQFITHYRFRYFDAHGDRMHPGYTLKPGAKDVIYACIQDLALRIDGAKHLKLPKLVLNDIFVDLPAKAERAYRQMEDQFFAELDGAGGLVTANGPAAVQMKLRQIVAGAVYEDLIDPLLGYPRTGPRRWHTVHAEKIEALLELYEELNGQQLLVMYEFGHDLARLAPALEKAGHEHAAIGGGTSDKAALGYEDEWNAGRLRLLLGHPASVGHGLNFQESSAAHIAVFSPTWNFEYYDQFIRRLLRQGNKSSTVTVHRILARNTVDEIQIHRLARKEHDQNDLNAAIEAYRRDRARS